MSATGLVVWLVDADLIVLVTAMMILLEPFARQYAVYMLQLLYHSYFTVSHLLGPKGKQGGRAHKKQSLEAILQPELILSNTPLDLEASTKK